MSGPVLVIGGTGLLGRSLVAALGSDAVATHHQSPPGRAGSWHPLDLADGGRRATALISSLRPAAVINAAYVRAGSELTPVTAEAPGAIAAAGAAVGARVVHVSSDIVFGGRARAYREDDGADPVHAYGRAKRAAEEAVAAGDPGAAIVRTSLLWDPAGCPQLDLVADTDVSFFTDEVRCPLRVDRLARACLELVDRPDITGVLHAGGADAVDRLGFARLLAPLAGRDPDHLVGRRSDPSDPRPRVVILDSSRARSLLRAPLPGVREEL